VRCGWRAAATAHCVGDRLVQVIDLYLQIHRHLRLARFGRPDRTHEERLRLKLQAVPALRDGTTAAPSSPSFSKSCQSSIRA